MTAIFPTTKKLKRYARSILFSNYQLFLFATLFFIAVSFGFSVLSSTYCGLLTEGMSADSARKISLTFDIVAFLLSFPFMLGYISLCIKLTRQEKVSFSELLRFYSKGHEIASCFTFLLKKIPEIFLKIILPFVLLFIAYEFLPGVLKILETYGFGLFADIISKTFFLWEIVALAIVMFLSGSILLSAISFCSGEKVKFSISEKWNFFTLRLSFVPLYILSVLTFGVLFTAYTLPYTLVTYSVFALKVSENVPSIDEPKNYETTTIFDKVNPEENL